MTAALLLVAAPPAKGAAKRKPCAMKHTTTLRDDGRARIFYRSSDLTYYGCIYRLGRIRELDRNGTNEFGLARFRLARPYVSYTAGTGASGATFQYLETVNLRTGRERSIANFAQAASSTYLEDVVLSRSGALAWITLATAGSSEDVLSVQKRDAYGRAILDRGTDVERGSLALSSSGHRIYWTNADEPRSAELR